MNYYLKVLKNYAVFSGRARRSEFWYFILFNIIFAFLAAGLDNVLGTTLNMGVNNPGELLQGKLAGVAITSVSGDYEISLPYGYIYIIYALATFIPGLAVVVRRLHDVGKSGWMYFIGLIPIIGAIWLLVLICKDSQVGSNKWGENPKEVAS